MELGMGIHGESGSQKVKLLPLRQATDMAFGQLFRGTRALDIKRDDDVLLLVNNLGSILLSVAMAGQSRLSFRWLFEPGVRHHRERCDRKSRASRTACETGDLRRTDDVVQHEGLFIECPQTIRRYGFDPTESTRCTDGCVRLASISRNNTVVDLHSALVGFVGVQRRIHGTLGSRVRIYWSNVVGRSLLFS